MLSWWEARIEEPEDERQYVVIASTMLANHVFWIETDTLHDLLVICERKGIVRVVEYEDDRHDIILAD